MRTYLSTLIFLLISQVTLAQVDLEKYNNTTTNQEYIDLLADDLKKLERFVSFFSKNSDEPRTPSEVAPLKVAFNQHDYDVNIDQVTQANIQFTDLMKDDFISIKLVQDPSIYRSLDDIKAPVYLKKVYYHDGTTQNIETKTNINTHFTPDLELTKAVDKIDIEIAFSTVKKIDSLVLPAKVNQKVTYHGVDIEVIEVSDKGILFKTSSDELKLDEIQAILKDKRRVSSYSSQRSGMHPKEFNLFIKNSVKKIDDIIAYANANIEMEHSQFKSVVGAKLSDLEAQLSTEFNKSEGVSYHYHEFGKPVDKLVIYNNNETYERSITKTLTNREPKSRYIGSKGGKTLIYNQDLKLVKEFSSKYFFINDYYFETDLQYFYLNDKLEMQPLSYYKVNNILNNFVVIQEDDESPQELVDPTNKKIMNVDSYEEDKDFKYALIASNNSYYLLNNKSLTPVKINNVDKVRTADKGYFVVMKDEKYGFMNTEGQIVVPIQYDEVKSFSSMTDLLPTDLLFAVKQKDKWGFVDVNNKTVIPFIYSGVKGTFSYGIALVYLDDALGLINLKNEKKSKFIDGNYSSSSNFGKRMINLSDSTYNYKGDKEIDN
ncbi:WG repeat-containing protein [Myroides sp. N17-2]|uniref:WG repeat-containing protein n=1 Tax=Myroides sp. N17-2 TaxID=2030799 RepID=UPI000EFAE82B|nr:WG repeat-containing protein [Myroides sp. N17-2]